MKIQISCLLNRRGHPDDYYDEDDFIDPLEQHNYEKQKETKQMTFQEEKEALKRKMKEDYRKTKPPKYKKESKDILCDLKSKKFQQLILLFTLLLFQNVPTMLPKTKSEGQREKRVAIITLTISFSYRPWERVHLEELD